MTEKGNIEKLARYIVKVGSDAPPKMTGTTTAGGTDLSTQQDRLPMPIGNEDDVLTVVDDGGDLIPAWAPLAAAAIAELDDIGDVNAPTPSNGDVLTWDSTPGEWIAAAPTGGSGAPTTAKYIVQEADAGLSAEQSLGALTTGLLKNTVTGAVGVLSTAAAGTDYVVPDATLTALAAFNTNGLLTQTAADTFTGRTITGTANQVSVSNGDGIAGNPTLSLPVAARTSTINFVIDGGGAVITTGIKGVFQVDFDGSFSSNTLLADQSGSIALTIKKSSYAGYPGSLTSIVASAKPTLSSAQKSTDATLTGWTTSFSAGDVFEVTADATPATVTRVTLALKAVRS